MSSALGALLVASPLLLIFGITGGYYACSPPLWQTTIGNLKAETVWPDLGVITCWCAMQLLFRCIVASVPRVTVGNESGDSHPSDSLSSTCSLSRIGAWLLWTLVVSVLSLPSIFFAFAQSLPAQNAWDLDDNMLRIFHATAPLLTVLIDMALAAPISAKFSKLTGVKADRLLMMFRLFSAWLLALLTTLLLDENCLGGWKRAWKVCQEEAKEHSKFNWKIFDEEILNTQQDICDSNFALWAEDRCSRALVGGLTPFLLKKLLTRSTLQPLILLVSWRLSRLDVTTHPQRGRHRRLFGIWPKTTGHLEPLKQMALLTTHMAACF